MDKHVRRGFLPKDEKEFAGESIEKLYHAGQDLYYLLNQGYQVKGASTFVGNHYLLSERQRLALTRSVYAREDIEMRRSKELEAVPKQGTIHIDGFNTIITLEVALSQSVLLKCMDGTYKDLAGLRGTYHLIDKTDRAIGMIGEMLKKCKIEKAVFYLDAPVSNSGRLKGRIQELLKDLPFEVEAVVTNNVDVVLEELDNVVTSDAIILNRCRSWFNLDKRIIESDIENVWCIDFGLLD